MTQVEELYKFRETAQEKIERKRSKIIALKEERDTAVIEFQKHLALKESQIAELTNKLKEFTVERPSTFSANMGPVTERVIPDFTESELLKENTNSNLKLQNCGKPPIQPSQKINNHVLKSHINNNDLNKVGQLAQKGSSIGVEQKGPRKRRQSFLALTRLIRSNSQQKS